MPEFRGSSVSGGADPAALEEHEADLYPSLAAQAEAAERQAADTVPVDMLADPVATRAAIAARRARIR